MNAYKRVLSLIFPNCCNFQDAEQQNLAIYALKIFIIVIDALSYNVYVWLRLGFELKDFSKFDEISIHTTFNNKC